MNNFEICLLIFLCLVAGFFLGRWLRFRLPDHHLSKESQDTIRLGAGMVATMSALVLGLLVSSAKSDFPTETSAVKTSVDSLSSAVKALPSSPSATQIAAIGLDASNVVSSVKSFTDNSKSKCS